MLRDDACDVVDEADFDGVDFDFPVPMIVEAEAAAELFVTPRDDDNASDAADAPFLLPTFPPPLAPPPPFPPPPPPPDVFEVAVSVAGVEDNHAPRVWSAFLLTGSFALDARLCVAAVAAVDDVDDAVAAAVVVVAFALGG